MRIQTARIRDLDELYKIGKDAPELRVSSTEVFMDKDEFKWAITSKDSVFLVAKEGGRIAGFIYTNAKDKDRPFDHRYACLVYLIVLPEFRRVGVASKLYLECEKKMRKMRINHIYLWANIEGDGGIVEFMKKQGFAEGHKYAWMDKKI